jgi:hypothetical protein
MLTGFSDDDLECVGGNNDRQRLTSRAASPPQWTRGVIADEPPLIDLMGDSAHGQEAPTKPNTSTAVAATSFRPSATPGCPPLATVPLIKQWAEGRLSEAQMGYDDDAPKRGRVSYHPRSDGGHGH